jgi:hypothetical protein
LSEAIEEQSLVAHFSVLEDPRDATKVRHKLLNIRVISVAAVIAGSDNWVDIAEFAHSKARSGPVRVAAIECST